MTNNGNRRPEEIESEIQQTRLRVDDTIDAIQDKLSPSQLMEQAIDYFRHSGSADFASNLGEAIKRNPVPVTLVGVGLAWLMMSGSSRNASDHQSNRDDLSGYDYDPDTSIYNPNVKIHDETFDKPTGHATADMPSGQGAFRSGLHNVRDKADAVKTKAQDVAGNMKRKAGDIAQGARARMDEMKSGGTQASLDRMSNQARQTKDQFLHVMEEQPLILGALGIAIGAALGAGLPSTRREDELMGKTRDDIVDKATETGQEQLEKAKSIATAAKESAMHEADKEGLTAEGAKDGLHETLAKAQRITEVAIGSAREEASKK